MKRTFLTIILSLFFLNLFAQKVDYLIKNGYVFDGLGTDSVQQDIGITGNNIVFVGNSNTSKIQAKKIIDVKGKYVSPGFIDPHTHIESNFNSDSEEKRAALIWLRQGVTTVLTGNDGYGKTNTGEIFAQWEKTGIGVNVAMYVGLGPVRSAGLGTANLQPTPEDLERMKILVENAMKEGAMGLSTGLSYQPQNYTKTPEISALAKVAAKYGGIYDTHMRGQGWPSSKYSIAEVLQIEQQAGIKVHISHIKVGPQNAFGKSVEIIKILDSARKAGSSIDASVYPYLASGDALSGMIPRWARENGNTKMLQHLDDPTSLEKIRTYITNDLANIGGGSKKQLVSRTKALSYLTGKTVADMAQLWKISEEETVIRLLKMQPNMGCLTFGMSEEDMLNFLKQPYIVVGSDGGETHPRGAGTFSTAIGEYTLTKKLMPLKEMIYKCTGLTAKIFKLKNRGVIKEGFIADIVVFDPKNYKTNATYQSPAELSTGVQAVFVNGKLAVENDVFNGTLAGKPIRFNQQ